MKNYDIDELNKFLFDANANGYAGGGNKFTPPQRPGFDEIEYKKSDFIFHDSYAGHYFAPGQETVYYQSVPVWAMAYAVGMKFEYHGDEKLAGETIVFLKKALMAMDKSKPFRGPEMFVNDEWRYVSKVTGDVKDFIGNEKIYHKGIIVFEQNFIGGVIV